MRKYIFEDQLFLYSRNPHFWILGTFFVTSSLASVIAAGVFRDDWPKKVAAARPQQPIFTAWLTAYLTTPKRKRIALAIYLGGLGLQVLEGYWIFMTLLSWTGIILYQWPNASDVAVWLSCLFVAIFVAMVVIDLMILSVWGAIILVQAISAAEIARHRTMYRYRGDKQKSE